MLQSVCFCFLHTLVSCLSNIISFHLKSLTIDNDSIPDITFLRSTRRKKKHWVLMYSHLPDLFTSGNLLQKKKHVSCIYSSAYHLKAVHIMFLMCFAQMSIFTVLVKNPVKSLILLHSHPFLIFPLSLCILYKADKNVSQVSISKHNIVIQSYKAASV